MLGDFVDAVPIVQDMLSHFFFAPAHKFPIDPNGVLRTIDLVHDESHQKINNKVYNIIELIEKITINTEVKPDIGSKHEYEEKRMDTHPLLIAHDVRFVPEAIADPD
jgi:hypothetical protein